MFYDAVERWRELVNQVVNEILSVSSTYENLLQSLNLTRYDVSNIVLGIIQKESSGDPTAVGDNGNSIGLMQLNFKAGTPQRYGYNDPEVLKDPYSNITCGTLHFLHLLNITKDVPNALEAFNEGHSEPNLTTNYAKTILGWIGVDWNNPEEKKSSSSFQS